MTTGMRVAVSTFPFLYSHSGKDALLHLAAQGYTAFEMMIFPPQCWPAESLRHWSSGDKIDPD